MNNDKEQILEEAFDLVVKANNITESDDFDYPKGVFLMVVNEPTNTILSASNTQGTVGAILLLLKCFVNENDIQSPEELKYLICELVDNLYKNMQKGIDN